jgi:hypothetical protein
MHKSKFSYAFLLVATLLCLCAPSAKAADGLGSTQLMASTDDSTPLYMDKDLAREHERFSSFATQQVHRMNATIIGGRNSMSVHRGSDGKYHASYRAIDPNEVICQVRRADHDPSYFVGVLIYKERILESVAKTAEACRRGSFEAVAETPHQVIYSSKRGGGWN